MYSSTASSNSFLASFSNGVWATWIEPGPSSSGSPQLAELGNVGGEFGDHGGQSLDGAQADEGHIEGELDLGQVAGRLQSAAARTGAESVTVRTSTWASALSAMTLGAWPP